MKKTLLKLVMLCLVLSVCANGQSFSSTPCGEVEQINLATNDVKRKILSDFVKSSTLNGSFSALYDKGIVLLHEYKNSKGEDCWLLTPKIDDSYKKNPPLKFSDFDGDIFLIYEADSTGNPIKTLGDFSKINECLEKIIGDRVFLRSEIKSRWTNSVLPVSNIKRKEGNRRNSTGSGGASIIIFSKDGGYRKTTPV